MHIAEAGCTMGSVTGTIIEIIDHGLCEIGIQESDSEFVSKHSNHELIQVQKIEDHGKVNETFDLNINEFSRILRDRKVRCTVLDRDSRSRLNVNIQIIE